jgi:hypothetical protein
VITFEELAQRFPIMNVAPYGACLVVPGAEFDPDWEVALGDQGCRCIMTDLDMRPVTLVQRRDARSNGKREVYAPRENGGEKNMEREENKPKHKGCQKGPSWSSQEEQRLLKRMQELSGPIKFRAKQLEPEFNRSAIGLVQMYRKLLKKRKVVLEAQPEIEASQLKAAESLKKQATLTSIIRDLQEATYDLRAQIVDLRNEFYGIKSGTAGLAKAVADCQGFTVEINDKVAALTKHMAKHKHAVSGEAMLPLEASN